MIRDKKNINTIEDVAKQFSSFKDIAISKFHEKIVKKSESTILAMDPSMTAFGWALISYTGVILKYGCIKTKKCDKKLRIRVADDNTYRISQVNKILLEVIEENNVTYFVSELQHGSQSAVAAKWQGAVTAIVQTLADAKNIGVEWYSESDSKLCLLGKRAAEKQETVDAIYRKFRPPLIGSNKGKQTRRREAPWSGVKADDQALADALSVYYTATKQSNVLKLLKTT